MAETKSDPRALRTRKLIMDSFIILSEKKDFPDITVKDITTEAMINRATFYSHFKDKYDLLDKALSEVLLVNLSSEKYEEIELNEEALVGIFIAVTNFQKSLSSRCHGDYEDTIARIIRDQLEVVLYKMLVKHRQTEDDLALKVTAVLLSWGIYGASVDWRKSQKKLSPEEYIKLAIPFIISGIHLN